MNDCVTIKLLAELGNKLAVSDCYIVSTTLLGIAQLTEMFLKLVTVSSDVHTKM